MFGWFREPASLASRSKRSSSGAQGFAHHFEGHLPSEPGVLGPVHLGHAPCPEQRHHLVRAEATPRCQTHGREDYRRGGRSFAAGETWGSLCRGWVRRSWRLGSGGFR